MTDETKDEYIDPFRTLAACNWEEDYPHENGNYINTCIECKMPFKGHKRRVICKICAGPNWEELAAKKAPENNKCAHAGCWAEGEMVGFARCMVKNVTPLQAEINNQDKIATNRTIDKIILEALLWQDDGVISIHYDKFKEILEKMKI